MEVLNMEKQKETSREKFIADNKHNWEADGAGLRAYREHLGLSLAYVGRKLQTSATRIRKLENGEPVSMADHLYASCSLLYEHEDMKKDLQKFFNKNYFKWRA